MIIESQKIIGKQFAMLHLAHIVAAYVWNGAYITFESLF